MTSPDPRTRADAVDALFESLLRISRSLRARAGDWTQAVPDLTRGDVVALGMVERAGSVRPKRLAGALGVDPSVVSRQLASLHRLGLVDRLPDPDDGRAELVELTDLGRRRLTEARTAMSEVLERRVTGWDLERIAVATDAVGALADVLQDDPGPRNDPHQIRQIHEMQETHV